MLAGCEPLKSLAFFVNVLTSWYDNAYVAFDDWVLTYTLFSGPSKK